MTDPASLPPSADDKTASDAADDREAVAAGHWLFSQTCRFLLGVTTLEALPAPTHIEVAFAGRSNVGKSSLINALTGRKSLARTSNTPGRTKEINFFELGPQNAPGLYLADLPGYGYARESKMRVADWNRLILAYLQGRPSLRRVLLLIDARHGLKENDLEVIGLLDKAAVSYQIVLTKADKPKPAELAHRIADIAATLRGHAAAHPDIVTTSSIRDMGLEDLRARIAALADLGRMGYKPRKIGRRDP